MKRILPWFLYRLRLFAARNRARVRGGLEDPTDTMYL